MKFETPTGLKGDARLAKGKVLGDALREGGNEARGRGKDKAGFDFHSHLIANCVDIQAWGIYREAVLPARLYTGDRMILVRAVWEETYRRPYRFPFACQACKKKQRWELDMKDLPFMPLDAEHRKILASGKNEIMREVEGIGPVPFSYSTGEIEAATAVLMADGVDIMTAMIACRIARLGEAVGPAAVAAALQDAPGSWMDELFALLDEYRFGIDNRIEVQCQQPACRTVQTVILPFDGGLFLPQSGSRFST